MADGRWQRRRLIALGWGALLGLAGPAAATTNDPWAIDFRYAPPSWQTAICLPDDWQKTLVGKDGSLLYDYPGSYAGFGTKITFGLSGETRWLKQELASPRVPIVRTTYRNGEALQPTRGARVCPFRETARTLAGVGPQTTDTTGPGDATLAGLRVAQASSADGDDA